MIKEKSVFKLAVFIGALVLSSGVSRAEEPNYVRITTYFSADSFVTATAYSDGLGKTIQNQLHIPHSEESVVSGTYFDGLGRDSITVKPFIFTTNHEFLSDQTSSNLIKKANTYYGPTNITLPQAYGFAYSETQYYDDPLGRIRESGEPGADFSISDAHHLRTWYFGLDESGSQFVPVDTLWPDPANILLSADALLNGKGDDAVSLYFLTVTRDANGNYTQELKDNFGQIVKKWANSSKAAIDTIVAEYEYDILGNLLKEIPPKEAGNLSTTIYEYNFLGQLIRKTSPDAGTVEYRYDKAGRMRFVRNEKLSNLNPNNAICYTYDAFGRNNTISINHGIIESIFNDPSGIEILSSDIKVQNYYDTILVSQLPALPNIDLVALLASLQNTHGQLAGTVAWDEYCGLHNRNAQHCAIDLFSYDDRGRVSDKYKYIPGHQLLKLSYTYDLQGNILSIIRDNNLNDAKTFSYNARGQLIEIGKSSKKLVSYNYHKTGSLFKKQFYDPEMQATGSNGFESVNYEYNIRDWTASIATTGTEGIFSEKLFYNDLDAVSTPMPFDAMPNYNGNISFASYTTKSNRNWNWNLYYQYDQVNRLARVVNQNTQLDEYSESYLYDKIGRIIKKQEGNSIIADYNQVYKYEKDKTKTGEPVTNRLAYIENKPVSTTELTATVTNPNYLYDPNGNMVLDRTKKMTISYDWRDLPVMFSFYESIPALDDGKITWQNIDQIEIIKNVRVLSKVNMVYDAAGSRVLKTTLVPAGSN